MEYRAFCKRLLDLRITSGKEDKRKWQERGFCKRL
jgi:hypothetical protein